MSSKNFSSLSQTLPQCYSPNLFKPSQSSDDFESKEICISYYDSPIEENQEPSYGFSFDSLNIDRSSIDYFFRDTDEIISNLTKGSIHKGISQSKTDREEINLMKEKILQLKKSIKKIENVKVKVLEFLDSYAYHPLKKREFKNIYRLYKLQKKTARPIIATIDDQ